MNNIKNLIKKQLVELNKLFKNANLKERQFLLIGLDYLTKKYKDFINKTLNKAPDPPKILLYQDYDDQEIVPSAFPEILIDTPKDKNTKPKLSKEGDHFVKYHTIILTNYPHQYSAMLDAQQFKKSANIVANRSALFPSEKSYNVHVTVTEANVVKIKNAHPTACWGIALTVKVIGNDEASVTGWINRFNEKSAVFTSTQIVEK